MKKISLKVWGYRFLRIAILITLLLLLFGGWSTQRQSDINEQVFWSPDRTTNTIGVISLIIGWSFWEWFASSKKRQYYQFYVAIACLVTATILINGILGTIAGSIAIVAIVVVFLLHHYKIQLIGKVS